MRHPPRIETGEVITTLTTANRVGWRYVTRDRQWALVAVKDRSNAYGKWGFVRVADLQPLPSATKCGTPTSPAIGEC